MTNLTNLTVLPTDRPSLRCRIGSHTWADWRVSDPFGSPSTLERRCTKCSAAERIATDCRRCGGSGYAYDLGQRCSDAGGCQPLREAA